MLPDPPQSAGNYLLSCLRPKPSHHIRIASLASPSSLVYLSAPSAVLPVVIILHISPLSPPSLLATSSAYALFAATVQITVVAIADWATF